ncbi:MAG: DUF2807 domain-containing protein [Bacteroidota bacterium]
MRKLILYLLLVLGIMILWGSTGCKKSGTNCISNSGDVIFEKRILADFDSINVAGNVNLIITMDSINSVTVESGKNIIDGITTTVDNHLLSINNTNMCNWLRSYNIPLNVHISAKNLQKIYYNASGNITTTNTLYAYSFGIIAEEGCGTIDIDMNIWTGYFTLQQGTVNFILRGRCAINSVFCGDYGLMDCSKLNTGYTFVTNQGSNDCYVQASQYLDATIKSIGNIYYSGNPDSLFTHYHGSGKIIEQ